MILALAACAALLASNVRTATGPDTWYSLVAGRFIWNNGIPHHDTLTSLTLGRPWVDQEWLGHLGIYGLFAIGGWALALLTGVLGYTAAFAVSAVGARRRGASERTVALVTFGAFLAGGSNTELRPQTFAFVFFALTLLLLLDDDSAPSRRVYLTLPLLVLWANVHGSVLAGAALVALYGAFSAARGVRSQVAAGRWAPRAAALLIAPWVCVLLTPYGFDLPGYYRRVLDNPALRRAASEWSRSTPGNQPVFYALLTITVAVVAVAARRGALSPFPLAVIALTALLGVAAVRNVTWFALTIAAILPAALDSFWRPSEAPRRRGVNLGLAVGGLVFAMAVAGWVALQADAWVAHAYPPRLAAAATRAASARPGTPIFVNEAWADWLLYQDPSLAGRIAYDIRYELFTQRELDSIVAFQTEQGPDWKTVALPFGLLVLNSGSDAGAVKWFRRRPDTVIVASQIGKPVSVTGL